jgi:ribosomal protein S18 acetylase RimI-like enzyme
MTRLDPMTADEFRESLDRGIQRVAEENVARGLWSEGQALEASRSEMAQLLPQGRETPGFSFMNIVDDRTGLRVGEIWYSTDSKGGRTHFWVHWIMVEPQFRRLGHGRETLRQLAARAKASGADRIGLHVVADNASALALYAALGYHPTSHRMARSLVDPPAYSEQNPSTH